MSRSAGPATIASGRATLTRLANCVREAASPARRVATRGRGGALGHSPTHRVATRGRGGVVRARSRSSLRSSRERRSARALSRERSDAGESGFEREREARWGKDRITTCGDRRRRDTCAPRRSPRVVPPSPASRTAFARRPLPLVAWRLAGEASRLPVSQTPRVATRGRGGALGHAPTHRVATRGRGGALGHSPTHRVANRGEAWSLRARTRSSRRVSKGAPGVSLTPPRCAGTPTAWARRRAVPPRRGGTPRRPRSPRRTAPAAGCSR